MVNLEILQRPASLAAPTVALQHSLSKCCVRFRIEPCVGAISSIRRRLLHVVNDKNIHRPRFRLQLHTELFPRGIGKYLSRGIT